MNVDYLREIFNLENFLLKHLRNFVGVSCTIENVKIFFYVRIRIHSLDVIEM